MKKGLVLIVDDDPDIRDTLRIVLEGNGYEVAEAGNGREALTALEARRPALMILDVMMSTDTEGFDLAYKLRNNPDYQDLPIVMLTSFLGKVAQEGPDQYQHVLGEDWPVKWLFEKPIEPKKLLAKIEAILGESEA